MRRFLLIALAASFTVCTPPSKTGAGDVSDTPDFDVKEIERVLNSLCSDEMRGRRTFTPEIDRAADLIAAEFQAAGLETYNNSPGFLQEFSLLNAKQTGIKGNADGNDINPWDWIVFTSSILVTINYEDGYDTASIGAAENFGRTARSFPAMNKNMLVRVDPKHKASFSSLSRLKNNFFKTNKNVVYFLGTKFPSNWDIEVKHDITEQKLTNVLGILPGKSRANEYVIFSAHYDHVGVGKAVNGDSIYNGANDDASGVAATILLAKHFAKQGPQERTLVFVTFTAEEIGGYGARYFSNQFDPASVVAMFNIEMIGTESRWGKNSAFITGYEKSSLGSLLQKNLEGSGFAFHPDPYTSQRLFYRSDNATLARLGVPAHSISTAKMENEPHYHQPSDEVKTLDLVNMARIIESIAISARSVVEGRETPTRVEPTGLN